MSVDTYGWIEVRNKYSGEWHGVLKFGPRVFPDTDNSAIRSDLSEFANGTGLPVDASKETIAAYDRSWCFEASWISPENFWQIDWENLSEGWVVLATVMRELGQLSMVDQVRLVFWGG